MEIQGYFHKEKKQGLVQHLCPNSPSLAHVCVSTVSLPDVSKVESDGQLEVELDGGTLVRPVQGIHDRNVNLQNTTPSVTQTCNSGVSCYIIIDQPTMQCTEIKMF